MIVIEFKYFEHLSFYRPDLQRPVRIWGLGGGGGGVGDTAANVGGTLQEKGTQNRNVHAQSDNKRVTRPTLNLPKTHSFKNNWQSIWTHRYTNEVFNPF